MYKVSADAGGGMYSTTEQLLETKRQMLIGSRNAGSKMVETPFGSLTGDQYKKALADLDIKIANSTQGISGLGSPGQEVFSLEQIDQLVADGTLRQGMTVPADIGGGRVID